MCQPYIFVEAEVADGRPDLIAGARVQPRGRFVQEEHAGLGDERNAERHTTCLLNNIT